MTTDDWVVLAMLWWCGRGRMAIARWLVDPAGAAQSGRDADVSLSRVLARIDASLAAPDRLTDA
ncbi:MAG: hypothetical protein OSB03_17075 [Vicinamibacterales bacterium]|jgi:hypothetical protein|nr:hypothetical protein [Vicinamibacterales bacterium]